MVIWSISLFKIKEKIRHTNLGVSEINVINLSCLLQNSSFPEIQQGPLYSFLEPSNIHFFTTIFQKSSHMQSEGNNNSFLVPTAVEVLAFYTYFCEDKLKKAPSYLEDWWDGGRVMLTRMDKVAVPQQSCPWSTVPTHWLLWGFWGSMPQSL